jgi:hypothetical protein
MCVSYEKKFQHTLKRRYNNSIDRLASFSVT